MARSLLFTVAYSRYTFNAATATATAAAVAAAVAAVAAVTTAAAAIATVAAAMQIWQGPQQASSFHILCD